MICQPWVSWSQCMRCMIAVRSILDLVEYGGSLSFFLTSFLWLTQTWGKMCATRNKHRLIKYLARSFKTQNCAVHFAVEWHSSQRLAYQLFAVSWLSEMLLVRCDVLIWCVLVYGHPLPHSLMKLYSDAAVSRISSHHEPKLLAVQLVLRLPQIPN